MQQIKTKMKKTNQENKHSKAKTTISLQHRIIKCNTKKIYHNVLDNNWEVETSVKLKRKKKRKTESKKTETTTKFD